MGLAISVGTLAELLQDDPESADELQLEFQAINGALRRRGLPTHDEPEALPVLDDRTPVASFPYSSLHYLRRCYAHLLVSPGTVASSVPDGVNPADDALIDKVSSPEHHLLWHSDAEGYYVPVDFPQVIESENIPGVALGSSIRLQQELCLIAPALGIRLEGNTLDDAEAERIEELIDDEGDLNIEIMVWIALFEAARLSITRKTAIRFG